MYARCANGASRRLARPRTLFGSRIASGTPSDARRERRPAPPRSRRPRARRSGASRRTSARASAIDLRARERAANAPPTPPPRIGSDVEQLELVAALGHDARLDAARVPHEDDARRRARRAARRPPRSSGRRARPCRRRRRGSSPSQRLRPRPRRRDGRDQRATSLRRRVDLAAIDRRVGASRARWREMLSRMPAAAAFTSSDEPP